MITIASLIIIGLGECARLLKENKEIIKPVLKESIKPALKESRIIIKNIEDSHKRIKYEQSKLEYTKWDHTEVGLRRSYTIPSGKSIDDIANAIKEYFSSYDGVNVFSEKVNSIYVIDCNTTKLYKLTGYNIKCNLIISQDNNYAKVRYQNNVDESVIKAVFSTNAIAGMGKLASIIDERQITNELDDVINKCLTS